jgi:predicted unusual protein kinase regulating ubiquinone biosynthesis (AarF/ABC1/UbiB family)
MAATADARATSGLKDRRRAVEARLGRLAVGRRPLRTPPPVGRLGTGEHPMPLVSDALADLGPLFAGFGCYLASRVDLVARRDAAVLGAIPDIGRAMTRLEIDACVERELGHQLPHRFFEFDYTARRVTRWTERHDAWLAPDVPVTVTLVRADAAQLLADAPLLTLLRPWFDASTDEFAAAADDYVHTLTRRLDQTTQAACFATLVADASSGSGGFAGPACYREHCASGILTTERVPGSTVGYLLANRAALGISGGPAVALARRLATAWLRQAITGRLVPFEFTELDILVDGDRMILEDGAFEPHSPAERKAFLAYADAVEDDDPEGASGWIMSGAAADRIERHEEEVRRRLRQAVPFRDGEWSGDDRFAEYALVQWRMARQANWSLTPHHLHLYRGLHAVSSIVTALEPSDDVMLAALDDERLRASTAARAGVVQLLNPATFAAAATRQFPDLLQMPRALDTLLTLASEGRLRVKLNVPEERRPHEVRNRTVVLVTTLIVLTGLASLGRYLAPAAGPGAEGIAALAILVLGGWLLVAAARL